VKLRDPLLLREQTVFANLIRDAEDVGDDVLHKSVGITRKDISPEILALRGVFFELRGLLQERLAQQGPGNG
jgi:hypothetical protein